MYVQLDWKATNKDSKEAEDKKNNFGLVLQANNAEKYARVSFVLIKSVIWEFIPSKIENSN